MSRRLARSELLLLCTVLCAGCSKVDSTSSSDSKVGAGKAVTTAESRDEFSRLTYAEAKPQAAVPEWAVDAVFYQIFPERFRNGDPSNDPTRASLEFPENVSDKWSVTPWTGDWYARADWELQRGDSFYEHGVFDRRYGGDLQGVIDKLDYLQKLGVNTLYFNPVFYGRSLHKYDGASMHHIDPFFGPDPSGDLELLAGESSDPASWQWTAADKLFLDLVKKLHARDMRIVIDGVFNHTGRDFFAFAHLREHQQDSPYRDWYIVQHFDNPETPGNEFRYKGWWGVDTLPEFADVADADAQPGADLHPGPKQYVMDITARWMDPNGDGDPADGIDGWRLDVANEVPIKFWQDWNAHVRKLNPQAYTVAEIWNDARNFLVDGGFSATMNYHAFAFLVKGFLIDGRLTAHDFGRELQLRRREFPAAMSFALQNLVDSHDTPRLASMIVNRPSEHGDRVYVDAGRFDYDVGERASPRHWEHFDVHGPSGKDRNIQKLVALMQMTYVGAPMVYYGTEAGMWGGDDPCDRMPMVWPDRDYDDQSADPLGRPRKADPVTFDHKLFDFYKSIIDLRGDRPALRRGSFQVLATDDDAQFIAIERKFDSERVLVALNRGNEDYRLKLPDGRWTAALTTGTPQEFASFPVEIDASIRIPGLQGVVLVSAEEN